MAAANNQRYPLVQRVRLDIHNIRAIIGNGPTTCLFHQKSQRRSLVQQAQLAMGLGRIPVISRVKKNSSGNEIAMKISHQ